MPTPRPEMSLVVSAVEKPGAKSSSAARETSIPVPLVVRLEGTEVTQGREILKKSGLEIETATDMADAAKKVVAAAGGAR